jgi:hypothetical protein
MAPDSPAAELKEKLAAMNKVLQALMDRTLYDDDDWKDAAKILRSLHDSKPALMKLFEASYGISFVRWYEFFSEFDRNIDEAITGTKKEDHSEDFVNGDLYMILKNMKEIKDVIEADVKEDDSKKKVFR